MTDVYGAVTVMQTGRGAQIIHIRGRSQHRQAARNCARTARRASGE
jgi:hypothetical protein